VRLRLSFELRLEMALRGLFSSPLKTGFPGRFAASSCPDRAGGFPPPGALAERIPRAAKDRRGRLPPNQRAGRASSFAPPREPEGICFWYRSKTLRCDGPAGPPGIGEAGGSLRAGRGFVASRSKLSQRWLCGLAPGSSLESQASSAPFS
jgi:hypothetical protein